MIGVGIQGADFEHKWRSPRGKGAQGGLKICPIILGLYTSSLAQRSFLGFEIDLRQFFDRSTDFMLNKCLIKQIVLAQMTWSYQVIVLLSKHKMMQ